MARKKIESTLPQPLVATDLGSDGVRSMAAERTADGLLHVLGVEQSARSASVERGVITSTSDASYGISESMRLLANRIKHPASFHDASKDHCANNQPDSIEHSFHAA